jgi:hypothetical protein
VHTSTGSQGRRCSFRTAAPLRGMPGGPTRVTGLTSRNAHAEDPARSPRSAPFSNRPRSACRPRRGTGRRTWRGPPPRTRRGPAFRIGPGTVVRHRAAPRQFAAAQSAAGPRAGRRPEQASAECGASPRPEQASPECGASSRPQQASAERGATRRPQQTSADLRATRWRRQASSRPWPARGRRPTPGPSPQCGPGCRAWTQTASRPWPGSQSGPASWTRQASRGRRRPRCCSRSWRRSHPGRCAPPCPASSAGPGP